MKKKAFEFTGFSLHLTAMVCMLLDHAWATVVPGNLWMTCAGRLAFPIFAFLLVEGYFHTRSLRRYLLRMLLFALISEIPFNLMMGGSVFYPFHQNVLWTFLMGLGTLRWLDAIRSKPWKPLRIRLAGAGIILLSAGICLLTMVDYGAPGLFMVLVFYFFRGSRWYHRLGQLAFLYWINFFLLSGRDLAFTLMGREWFFPIQGFALLALIPLWLYRGKQGYHGPPARWCFYWFYPLHILILWALSGLI